MALNLFYPHRCGRNYWDVWDWPTSLFGQNFGIDLDDFDDILTSRRLDLAQRSGASEVANTKDKFALKLDCSHFKPEEIEVKTVGNNVVIHGKHEERTDKHGWVQREFTRRYALPEGCEPEKVVSNLSSNGVLVIEAPKKELPPLKQNERVVPIAMDNSKPAITGRKK